MNQVAKNRRTVEKIYNFRDKVAGVQWYIDSMMNRTLTMFRYNGLPESLPERELELILQFDGKGIVTEHEGEIVMFSGEYAPDLDMYYRPKNFLVANPWAKVNKEFEIYKDKEAILWRNDPLDRGLLPIMEKYGAMLTENDLTMVLADINMRVIFNIIASTNNEIEAATQYLRMIEEGKQGVLMSDEMSDNVSVNPASNSQSGYITQVIEYAQYVWGKFLNEIGLNANYNMKRERLSASETDLNEDMLRPLIDAMLEERQKAVDKINAKYGTDITVEFNSSWAKYNPTSEIEPEDEELESDDDVIELESPVEETEPVVDEDVQPEEEAVEEESVEESDEVEDVVEDEEEVEESDDDISEEPEELEEEITEEEVESPESDIVVNIEVNVDTTVDPVDYADDKEEESDEKTED